MVEEKVHLFDLYKATRALARLRLESLVIGDYLVVVRSDIDAFIDGDPYVALMLMFNMMSGYFIARVWNETVTVGTIQRLEDFLQSCKEHFHFKPCIGCPSVEDESESHRYLQPKIRFSKGCHRFLKEKDMGSCPECEALTSSGTSTAQCKVEVCTETAEVNDSEFLPKEELKLNPDISIGESETDWPSDLDQALAYENNNEDIDLTDNLHDSDSCIDDSQDSD